MKVGVVNAVITIATIGLAYSASAETGLILRTIWSGTSAYQTGSLEIETMSTGKKVTLEGGGVYGAVISPDGSRVAYIGEIAPNWAGGKLITIKTDGSDRKVLATVLTEAGTKEPYVQWCTDGSIYWGDCGPKLYKISQDGGTVAVAHEAQAKNTKGGNPMVRAMHNLSMSLDGTRAIWTKGPPTYTDKFGWSNTACNIISNTEIEIIGGCQATMSPDGTLMGRATGRHHRSHVFDWDLSYEEYNQWSNTYDGCLAMQPDETCPAYLGVVIYPDGVKSWMCRWASTDPDVYLIAAENGNDGYMWRFSTESITTLGHGVPWDYFPSETSVQIPNLTITPQQLQFSLATDYAQLPQPRTVTVSGTVGFSFATITGVPPWLSVTTTLVAGQLQIINTLQPAALPGVGTYTATLSVVPSGTSLVLSYMVELVVTDPVVSPIIIHAPIAGSSCAVNDTLAIRYSARCNDVPSVILELSVDSGDTWSRLSLAASEPCGENMVYKFVVPPSMIFGATALSTVSNRCFVQVKRYPSGDETSSGLFSIVPGLSTAQPGNSTNRKLTHTITSIEYSSPGLLRVTAVVPATIRLYDVVGTLVAHARIRAGVSSIPTGRLSAGHYLARTFPLTGGPVEISPLMVH